MTILISGLINIETTLKVEGFPIHYHPVRYPFFGIRSTVSGVGYNLAKALTTLGDSVHFLSMIGCDPNGTLVRDSLAADSIPGQFVLDTLEQTPQSVILYDETGRRQINVDLKNIQEQNYPLEQFEAALAGCSLAALCNINFSRPFLMQAKKAGVLVATDVHTIDNLNDSYNHDFMANADILFMSDEHLPCSPEEWAQRVQNQYGNAIIVIGLGVQGALLSLRADHFMERVPAVQTRPIINTIGAGDALFSAFLHGYLETGSPYEAIRKAMVFASFKVGANGAADGFLTSESLDVLYRTIYKA
mgnify:CR=1 FL=1